MPKPNVKPKPKVEYVDFRYVKLQLPSNAFLYKIRRYKWLLTNYSRLLEKDPTAISFKEYSSVLEAYTKLVEQAQKKGLDTREGRYAAKTARQGVDTRTVAQDDKESDEASTFSDDESFGLGIGV